jgi:hypothetical protein
MILSAEMSYCQWMLIGTCARHLQSTGKCLQQRKIHFSRNLATGSSLGGKCAEGGYAARVGSELELL